MAQPAFATSVLFRRAWSKEQKTFGNCHPKIQQSLSDAEVLSSANLKATPRLQVLWFRSGPALGCLDLLCLYEEIPCRDRGHRRSPPICIQTPQWHWCNSANCWQGSLHAVVRRLVENVESRSITSELEYDRYPCVGIV